MDTLNYSRCAVLNNIPEKKLREALLAIEESTIDPLDQSVKKTAVMRYYESNIPIGYWSLKMERDFVGI